MRNGSVTLVDVLRTKFTTLGKKPTREKYPGKPVSKFEKEIVVPLSLDWLDNSSKNFLEITQEKTSCFDRKYRYNRTNERWY